MAQCWMFTYRSPEVSEGILGPALLIVFGVGITELFPKQLLAKKEERIMYRLWVAGITVADTRFNSDGINIWLSLFWETVERSLLSHLGLYLDYLRSFPSTLKYGLFSGCTFLRKSGDTRMFYASI